MSTNQILYKSQESYHKEATKQLLYYGNQSYIFNHYRAGEKPDYDKMTHALMIKRVTGSRNCDFADYLKDLIAGKLEPCDQKKCLSELVQEYKTCFKKTDCTDTEIICDNIGLVQF